MKRLNLIALLLVLCLVFAACGKKEDKIEQGSSDTETKTDGGSTTTVDLYHECTGTVTKLADYKGIEYTIVNTEVTDKDVDEYIEYMLKNYPCYIEDETKADSAIADGDVICLDYSGSLNGEKFSGGTAEGQTLEIGSDSFVGTFEDQMIGHKKGDEFTINVTFPDSYSNTDLAGKETQFEIKINYICKASAEITDAWVKDMTSSKYSTVSEYREYLVDYIKSSVEDEAEDQKYADILEYLKNNSEYTIAETDKTYYYDYLYGQLESYASYYGIDTATMALYAGYSSLDAFKEECNTQANEMAIEYTLLQAIEKDAGITVTDEEFTKRVSDYMTSAGATDQATFLSSYGEDYVRYVVRMDMTWDYLKDNAVGVEKEEKTETGAATEDAKTETAAATEDAKTETAAATEDAKTETAE